VQATLEAPAPIVGVKTVALGSEQLLHQGILPGRELHHEGATEGGEPVDDLPDRDVGADGDVLRQGKS
jgi:hypothetical protein